MSIAKGILLWLARKNTYPEQWVASMIGVAEEGLRNYPGITYIIIGLAGLFGLFIWPLLYKLGVKIFSYKQDKNDVNDQESTDSFDVKLDQGIVRIGDYDRICAIIVKNIGFTDLDQCLVKLEQLSCGRPNDLSLPHVLRNEGQVKGKRKGRFNLSTKEPKNIPILFCNHKRKNEWFFFDENFDSNQKTYFIPAGDIKLVIGLYGGEVNCKVLIEIESKGFEANSTIREVPDEYTLSTHKPKQENIPLSEAARSLEGNTMTDKPTATGFKIRGNGNILGNNLSVGLDVGYDVDGVGNELYGNRAMTHEQFSEYLKSSTFAQPANTNNDPVVGILISKITIELNKLGISSEKFEAIKKEVNILRTQLNSLAPIKKYMNYSLEQIKRPISKITKHHELNEALLDISQLIDKKGA